MAPEQFEAPGEVDQRADIYSLGVVFYELLTGELPIGRFAPPSEKTPMDARIDEIVMRTLEREREARFQSVGDVETRVQEVSQSEPEIAKAAESVSATAVSHSGKAGPAEETAKYSLASAIFTGSALLLAGVVALPILFGDIHDPGMRRNMGNIIAVAALIVGVPTLLGMVFGFNSLGDIRRSGGRKAGYGSAMFGALTLPVILVLGGTGALLAYVLPSAGIGMGPLVVVSWLVGGILAVSLVRAVGRSVRGVPRGARRDGGAAPTAPTPVSEPAGSPLSAASEPARFANAAAVLTGVALLLAGVSFVTLPLLVNDAKSDTQFAIIMLIAALAVGIPALLGMIFGCMALGDIRRSGSRKFGMGGAMFGVLTVPVLAVIGMTGAMFTLVFMSAKYAQTLPLVVFATVAAVAGLVSLIMLIRALGNWTRGGDSGRRLAVWAIVLILVVALELLVFNMAPAGDPAFGSNWDPPRSEKASVSSSGSGGNAASGQPRPELWDIHWDEAPNVVLHIIVPKGDAATIELVRTDASGRESVSNRWSAIASDRENFEGVIAMGTPASLQRKQVEGGAALHGTFWSLKEGPVFTLAKFYEGKLSLGCGQRRLDLTRADQDEGRNGNELGTFEPGGAEDVETLSLRVVSEPRQSLVKPFVLEDALIGTGSPSEVMEEQIKR